MPRSAKEANNPILLKVQSLQLSFRPAGVSLGGGGGGQGPPWPPPAYAPGQGRESLGIQQKRGHLFNQSTIITIQVGTDVYNPKLNRTNLSHLDLVRQ